MGWELSRFWMESSRAPSGGPIQTRSCGMNSRERWITLGPSKTRSSTPCQALHPLNAGLTPAGLSNWTNSFHATFLPIQGYESIIDSSLRPGTAVAIAKSDAWPDPWTGLYWLGDEEDHECVIPANYRRINTLQPGDAGAPSSGAR